MNNNHLDFQESPKENLGIYDQFLNYGKWGVFFIALFLLAFFFNFVGNVPWYYVFPISFACIVGFYFLNKNENS